MAQYNYLAFDQKSKKTKGTMQAKNQGDLIKKLSAKGLYLSWYKEVAEKDGNKFKIKSRDLSDFCRELSTMLSSGVTIIRAMEIMTQRDVKPKMKIVYTSISKDLQQGNQLSTCMENLTPAFPELLINMIKSGEASGQLDKAAMKMALYYEQEHKLHSKIVSAMVYPIVLLVVLVLVLIAVFVFILPAFFDIFKGMELPLITQFVMGISTFLVSSGWQAFAGCVFIFASIGLILKRPKVAIKYDHFKLKLPIAGKLLRIIYTARFARTLSSLYSSGVSIVEATAIASTTIGNKYIAAQFPGVRAELLNGRSLSACLKEISGLDVKLVSTILIGEESGRLDTMLDSVAASYDYDAQMATDRLVALIGPIFIIFMAVIVGVVMLSAVIPMMSIFQNIG